MDDTNDGAALFGEEQLRRKIGWFSKSSSQVCFEQGRRSERVLMRPRFCIVETIVPLLRKRRLDYHLSQYSQGYLRLWLELRVSCWTQRDRL